MKKRVGPCYCFWCLETSLINKHSPPCGRAWPRAYRMMLWIMEMMSAMCSEALGSSVGGRQLSAACEEVERSGD